MKTKIIIAFAILIMSIFFFWLGSYLSSNKIHQSINELQAQLAFSHLVTYEELKLELENGCNEQSLLRLRHAIDAQKMLMAEYVQTYNDKEFSSYISLRSSSLIDELAEYEINWNKKWSIPNCVKKD